MNTKRQKAMQLALALHRFAKQMMKEKETNKGFTHYTFWFCSGPKSFKTPEQMLNFSNKIAKSALK